MQMSSGFTLCVVLANRYEWDEIRSCTRLFIDDAFSTLIVADLCIQRDAELGIVAESAVQMQQEYSAKAVAINSELSFAGIDVESLPPNVADNVDCLVSFAASLGCEDCSEATLCCALEELEQRRVNIEDSLAAERNRQHAIRDYTNDVSIRLQEVRRVVEGLTSDTEVMESSAALNSPMTFQLEEKCRDYTQRLIALKSQLASVCTLVHFFFPPVNFIERSCLHRLGLALKYITRPLSK
jgi:hypothetical protein